MRIDPKGKFYRWNYRVAKFAYKKGHHVDASLPTNVCALFWFMLWSHVFAIFRLGLLTVIVSASTIIGFIGLIYPFAYFSTTVYEFLSLQDSELVHFIILGLLSAFVWLIALLAAFIGIAILVTKTEWYDEWSEKRGERKRKQMLEKLRQAQSQKPQEKSSGFWDVVVAYIKAGKKKVCPTIEYARNEDESA